MTVRLMRALSAGLLLAAWPSFAHAQTQPDLGELVTQGEQINRSVEDAVRNRTGQGADEETAIDDEAGIYVLTVNEIFQISGSAAIGYTDNAERTADSFRESFFADASIAAGVATRIGGTVDFGLSANVSGREFFDAEEVSTRTVSGNVSLGTEVIGPVYASVVGFGGYSFNTDFENGTAFYGVSASLSAALPLSERFVVRPGVGVTRQWAEVSENNSTSALASLELLYAPAPGLTASVRGTFGRRWYDDFYEDVTFVEREDQIHGVSATISYRPVDNLVIAATVSYDDQNSTFFLSEYDAFEAAFALAAVLRF